MVPPEAVQESFSSQLQSTDSPPEQEPQKPHLLKENGEVYPFSRTDVTAAWVPWLLQEVA